MKKPNQKRLEKEIKKLQSDEGIRYEDALKIIVDKYSFCNVNELESVLYSELFTNFKDLSIVIKKNLTKKDMLIGELYQKAMITRVKIVNSLEEKKEDKISELQQTHDELFADIAKHLVGEIDICATFSFSWEGFKLYLHNDPEDYQDYTCLIEYIGKESRYLITQKKCKLIF